MRLIVDNKMADDLLEYLRHRVGLLYISDMHYSPYREEAIRVAACVEVQRYSPAVWHDAAEYLLGQKGLKTAEEAQAAFAHAAERTREL